MTKIFFYTVSTTFLFFLVLINIFALDRYPFNLIYDLNSAWLEPSLTWSLALVSISVLILLLDKQRFWSWFRKFFIWYFPVAYLLTFTFPTYGGLMVTTRSAAAIFFGVLMVFVTIGFVVFKKN